MLILVDSSIWIEGNRPGASQELKARIRQLLLERRLAVTPLVQLEIYCGAHTGSIYEELRKSFAALENLSVTEAVWDRSYDLGFRAKRLGFPRLAPDILIAAVAVTHKVFLWHCDRDFERLRQVEPALRTYWHPHNNP